VLIRQANSTPKLQECRWASYYLVISLIAVLSSNVGNCCPTAYCLAMAVYITGLITQPNAQTTLIAANVGMVSHDQLSRMLRALGWSISSGAIWVVRFIEYLGITNGYLIIDDVLIPKPFAELIAFSGWDWDHSRHYNVFGQRLVFVVWSNGCLTIPLLFAFWQKDPNKPGKRKKRKRGRPCKKGRPITDFSAKARERRTEYRRKRKARLKRKRLPNGVHYRSKNELARVMVWKLMRVGIKCNFILFDNWYASEENFALFERLHLYWVSRTKENAKVCYLQQRIQVKEVAATVEKANYHYYDTINARVRSFQVTIADHIRKLTVIKDDTAPESGRTKYLMTNATWLTNMEHIFWYRKRWSIEVFFRDIKQHLNLTTCEARNEDAIIAHVVLVCIAYTFMQLLKPLDNQQRPSIGSTIKTIAPLLVVANGHFARPNSSGSFQVVYFDHLVSVLRTGFPNIPCPVNPLLT
jgi:hypothetical protein